MLRTIKKSFQMIKEWNKACRKKTTTIESY